MTWGAIAKRRDFLLSAICSTVAVALAGCGDVLGRDLPSYRYRLTVEVNTPEGLKTGSSVIEVESTTSGSLKLPDTNARAISG